MSPQIAFSKLFATLAGIWLAGFLMRRAAVHSENELVSQVAAMTLFAPMSVAVAWIGWRTRTSWREIALMVLVILAAFIGWNGVMLFGVPSDVLFRAIQTNAAHWVYYLLAGALSTRFFQWFCGIGIWSRERGEGVQLDEPNAKPLSIMKLMMMVALIAFLMAAYRHWVILSNDYLVELKSRIKLWQFIGTNYMTHFGSTPVFGVNNGGGMRFMPTTLPTPDAEKMLETALKQPNLFVWRKGVDVRIDVDGVPSPFQAEVSKALNDQAQRMNCRVSPSAAITLKASVSGPKAEAVSYFFGGSFVLQQYQSTLQIVYSGNPIWSGTATNTPGAVSRGTKEEMQKQIDDAGQRPNISYFAATALPEFLQKPEANATGGRNKQTIGVSRVTATGLQTEK